MRENSPPEIIQARDLQDTVVVPFCYPWPLIPPPELEEVAGVEVLPTDPLELL